eukprot:TRINITY_DN9932_c0_g1_i1.p1 TRINITY_DN9932_c0_g1~~TRINITY_DN9932_c0_g1_i1.p1  ORF type:complete len:114 (-),score=18.32 TRINITY_DN9932_c0_g1_i1:423-764(-)
MIILQMPRRTGTLKDSVFNSSSPTNNDGTSNHQPKELNKLLNDDCIHLKERWDAKETRSASLLRQIRSCMSTMLNRFNRIGIDNSQVSKAAFPLWNGFSDPRKRGVINPRRRH